MKKSFLSTFALLLATLALTACETVPDENRDAGRPANELGTGDDVYGSQLPELVPGSQADLVAHVGDRVFYGYDSAQINDAAQTTLQRQAEWLKENAGVTVTIEGHCDERGTREYNLALGERRAAAARDYLVSLGVQANRLSIISYGKEYPEDPGENEIAWSKNRRAVTVVNNR